MDKQGIKNAPEPEREHKTEQPVRSETVNTSLLSAIASGSFSAAAKNVESAMYTAGAIGNQNMLGLAEGGARISAQLDSVELIDFAGLRDTLSEAPDSNECSVAPLMGAEF